MFASLIGASGELSLSVLLLCTAAALGCGLVIAGAYRVQGPYSKSLMISLVMLPALVEIVILMVNGNLGAGVAVLGAFGLVRFRSVPGTSKEICFIFFAMAVGLAMGMGYVGFGILITLILCAAFLALFKAPFGNEEEAMRELRITMPENLDYTEIFDDIFAEYLAYHSLEKVKTVNLGSMFELTYRIRLKEPRREKELIDGIRCRNGNLTVICCRVSAQEQSL
ncbi:MAG: DUF4956 domain-containing protein [Peptococcaceae bacterium]|nr:DUF4956 domain-containing protein [Peptococcaceae bacterium]